MAAVDGEKIEVHELRQQIEELRQLLHLRENPSVYHQKIRIFVERCQGVRRPFLFIFQTSRERTFSVRVSPTRAAILLTLLADLEQRFSGLGGISNIRSASAEVLQAIAPDLDAAENLQEQIRVGLYRFDRFWKEQFAGSSIALYDSALERLVSESKSCVQGFELISKDPAIIDALPKLGGTTMLERLRKDQFLFVPSGGSSGERFLREVYEVPAELKVMITYGRPQLITLPSELLKRHCSNPEVHYRHAAMHKKLSEGKLSFTEIVLEESLEQLSSQEGGYYYPGMTSEEQDSHYQFLEQLIESDCGYRLILTRAEIPFYAGVYRAEALLFSPAFQFTSFFRLSLKSDYRDWSSFVVWGEKVASTISNTVFDWLLQHPATDVDVTKVLAKVRRARDRLKARISLALA